MKGKAVDQQVIVGVCTEVWTLKQGGITMSKMMDYYIDSLFVGYVSLHGDVKLYDSDTG